MALVSCAAAPRRSERMLRNGSVRFRRAASSVLGAFQVSDHGDLADWSTGEPGAVPAVGEAMDLARGAKEVYVMTDLFTKSGEPKLVTSCSYPLTAVRCVKRIYTDHAIFEVTARGFRVRETFGGLTTSDLEFKTGLKFHDQHELARVTFRSR